MWTVPMRRRQGDELQSRFGTESTAMLPKDCVEGVREGTESSLASEFPPEWCYRARARKAGETRLGDTCRLALSPHLVRTAPLPPPQAIPGPSSPPRQPEPKLLVPVHSEDQTALL